MGLARKIILSSFWLSLSNLMSRSISFFAVILITGVLDIKEYGALVLVLTVTGPVDVFSGLGLESVILSDMASFRGKKKYGHVKKLMCSYVVSKLVLATIILGVAWFYKDFLATRFGSSVLIYLHLLIMWVYAVIINNMLGVILNAHEQFKALSASKIVETSTKLVCVILFWLMGIMNLYFALLSYVIAKCVVNVFYLASAYRATRYLHSVRVAQENILKNIIMKHGKWDIFSQTITEQLEASMRPWIVKYFIGVEGVAIFSVARNIYTTLIEMVPIKQVIFPIISRSIANTAKNIIIAQKVSKYSFLIYLGLASISFFAISPFINIFFPKYISSILIFRILLVRMLVTATSYGQHSFFYAFKDQKVLFFIGLMTIISLFTVLPASLFIFGLAGVYIERVVTLSIIYSVKEWYLRKYHGIITWKFSSLFVYDAYDKIVVSKLKETVNILLRKMTHIFHPN